MEMSAVRTLVASKPGWTARRCRKLFIRRPAEMSNTSASAISETTRASRKVFRPGRIGGAASTGAQCIREAADRNLCGRSHSEYGAAQERDGGGETKNSEIDGHVRQFANHFGPDRFEDMDAPNGQQQTSGAAQRTQQQ